MYTCQSRLHGRGNRSPLSHPNWGYSQSGGFRGMVRSHGHRREKVKNLSGCWRLSSAGVGMGAEHNRGEREMQILLKEKGRCNIEPSRAWKLGSTRYKYTAHLRANIKNMVHPAGCLRTYMDDEVGLLISWGPWPK